MDIYVSKQDLPKCILDAFPSYKGRKFKIAPTEEVRLSDNYWSDGTKYTYRGVDLATGKTFVPNCDEFGNPFVNPNVPTVKLSENQAIVCHKIFCGKDLGLTIFVHPQNMSGLIPQAEEVTEDESIVIDFTASYKSSYAGIPNYRFHEANRAKGISKERWESAKQSCIQKGLLNERGALTIKGKNARKKL